MNNDLVKVAQGQIHVNDIGLIKTGPGIFVFTVDCKAKRFEIGGSVKDYGTNELSILLAAGPETLYADENSEEPTWITFKVTEEGDWEIDGTASKYNAFIFLWRWGRKQSTLVWSDE